MLKALLTPACAMALLFAGGTISSARNKPANDNRTAAQNSTEQKSQQQTTTTNGGTLKSNTDTVYGKVEDFTPGKSIKVSVPGKLITSKSFDLSGKDITANVAPSVKVGDWVRVREKTDNNGHKTLTVNLSSEKQATHGNKS
jgi:hypothetical protein